MEPCFKNIPQKVRQQAFAYLVQAENIKSAGGSALTRFVIDGQTYCPWGAVNLVYNSELAKTDPNLRIPLLTVEQDFLRTHSGLGQDELPSSFDVGIFMGSVDKGNFLTFRSLARAMGIKYNDIRP